MKAAEVDRAVRELYAKNGYVVLSEVRNGTGFERSARTADMLAVSTWPSRGLYFEGFEIKVSYGDLRRELANPEKAESIARYCRRWWLAMPEGMEKDCIIPETWGVISVDAKLKAKITKPAPALEPIEVDILFVCAVLRNFSEHYVHESEVSDKIQAGEKLCKEHYERMKGQRLKDLESAVTQFKAASGIDLLTDWGHPVYEIPRFGEAVRMIAGMSRRPSAELVEAKSALTTAAAAIDVAINLMEATHA